MIAEVVLALLPAVIPVTFTVKVQDAPAARVAPVKLTVPDPAVAVMVPPPQEPVSPFGVDTTRPAGSVSMNSMLVTETVVFGFVMLKLRVVEPFSGTVVAPNALVIVGGISAVDTVAVSDTVAVPVPGGTSEMVTVTVKVPDPT